MGIDERTAAELRAEAALAAMREELAGVEERGDRLVALIERTAELAEWCPKSGEQALAEAADQTATSVSILTGALLLVQEHMYVQIRMRMEFLQSLYVGRGQLTLLARLAREREGMSEDELKAAKLLCERVLAGDFR